MQNVNPAPIELLSKHYREQYFANNRAADEAEEQGSSLYSNIMSTLEKDTTEVQVQPEPIAIADVIIAEPEEPSADQNYYNNNDMMDMNDDYSGEGSSSSSFIDTVKLEAEKYILHLLNHGTYDDLLKLRGIGQTRAMKMMTARNAGRYFTSLQELEEIDMNSSAIKRFRRDNLGYLFA